MRVEVWATVGDERIRVNDADPYVVPLGDIPGGQTVTRQLSLVLRLSLGQALKAQETGMEFHADVKSEEMSRSFRILCTQTECTLASP